MHFIPDKAEKHQKTFNLQGFSKKTALS